MIQRIRTVLERVQDGINTGLVLGLGIIFLTLIGLPSDDSEPLAAISVELYLLITAYIAWRMARKYTELEKSIGTILSNTLALGLSAAVVLLLFLAIINNWHAQGTNVEGLYFANMNTYPMHILSGIPLEELHPDPPVDPITKEIPPGSRLRTSPYQLSFEESDAIFSIGPIDLGFVDLGSINIGGLYGLLVLLSLSGIAGSVLYLAMNRIDFSQLSRPAAQGASNHWVLSSIRWLILLTPLLIFALFWLTVEHERSSEMSVLAISALVIKDITGIGLYDWFIDAGILSFDNFQVINLSEVLGLTSDSLIDAPSIQLGLTFLIVILSIVALRRAIQQKTTLPYALRAGIPLAVVAMLLLLALWRIEAAGIDIVAPSIDVFGLTNHGWTRLIFLVGSLGLVVFILLASRDESFYELVFTGALGLTIFLISPLFMDQYQTFVMGRVMLAVMFGLGLNIVVGYAGLLDLGYVAFYAIGAYTFAFIAIESEQFKLSVPVVNDLGWTLTASILLAPLVLFAALYAWQRIRPESLKTTENEHGWKRKTPVWTEQPPALASFALMFILVGVLSMIGDYLEGADLGVFATNNFDTYFSTFLIAILIALITGAFAGIMLGFPVLRLRGDYLAIVTLGFGEIISLALKNLDTTTGGPSGALGVPKPVPDGTSVPVSNLVLLYLGIIGAFVVIIFSLNLRSSRIGRAWLAMKSDEDIAQAMGINLVNVKLLAFSIGAAMAALAGMIFAARQNSIFPDDFNLEVSINVLSLVIIGGMGSVPGVVIGSIVLIGLPELLRPVEDYRIMAFGLLLIITMVTRPEGLLPAPPPELEERARILAEAEKEQPHA